jgi:hypothetical protein
MSGKIRPVPCLKVGPLFWESVYFLKYKYCLFSIHQMDFPNLLQTFNTTTLVQGWNGFPLLFRCKFCTGAVVPANGTKLFDGLTGFVLLRHEYLLKNTTKAWSFPPGTPFWCSYFLVFSGVSFSGLRCSLSAQRFIPSSGWSYELEF